MNNKEGFKKALDFRHACKTFCKKKIINDKDMEFILESARMTPTSFGMEGYKLLVITNNELKEKLRPVCWNQAQITTCSHLVVILSAIEDLYPKSDYVKEKFKRRRLTKEQEEAYLKRYEEFINITAKNDNEMFAWSSKQTYLLVMTMMLAGATLEIDSCPIEGFEREKVEKILDIDTKKFRVSLLLPFGYRIYPQPKHLRDDLKSKVEFIN
jgi:nitroreductase